MINCAVIGTGAMGKKYAEMLDSGRIGGLGLSAVCCRSSVETFEFEETDDAYEKMFCNFAEAVSDGAELIAPGRESERTLQIINAAYLSAWQGKRVTLPADMREYAELLHKKELDEQFNGG